MIRRFLTHLSPGAVILLLTASAAFAQATAQLGGTVRDESGAVLPGVTVTATQTDTGFTRTVVTDGEGGYVMPNLPTGPYRLEVALAGFRTYQQTGIVLQVGASPSVNAVLAQPAAPEVPGSAVQRQQQRPAAAAFQELSRIPVHRRGPEGVDQAVDLRLETPTRSGRKT